MKKYKKKTDSKFIIKNIRKYKPKSLKQRIEDLKKVNRTKVC